MKKLVAILGTTLSFSISAVAQKTATLPVKGIAPGTANVGITLIVPNPKWLPSRQQCMYPSKDLPASPIAIREVAFQPRLYTMFVTESSLVTLTLDMSIGPRLPRKYSRTFSLNHGKKITRVFAGRIQLPRLRGTSKQDWYFRVPFQRPFLADKKQGPSLVLDFSTSSVITKMNRGWDMIQAEKDRGNVRWQSLTTLNCHFQKFRAIYISFSNGIFVGSQWDWGAGPLLPNQPGFLALGDAGLGAKWGGLTLPIDLKPMGAPGCAWDVRPFLFLPFVVDSWGGAHLPRLRIPNDNRLANKNLYLQAAYTYPKANALGWLFLPSLVWRIGSGEETDAVAHGTANNFPPKKTSNRALLTNPVPYLRITY